MLIDTLNDKQQKTMLRSEVAAVRRPSLYTTDKWQRGKKCECGKIKTKTSNCAC